MNDPCLITGIVLFTLFAAVAVWIALPPWMAARCARQRIVSALLRFVMRGGARCPSCKGPSTWRTCSAEVAPELYTAAICRRCNRVGGAR